MPWNHRKLPRSDDLGVSVMKGLIFFHSFI